MPAGNPQIVIFDQSLDWLRNMAEMIARTQGSVCSDDMYYGYPNEWSGLNSWKKGNFFEKDERFIFKGYKHSLQPKSNGREIKVWGLKT